MLSENLCKGAIVVGSIRKTMKIEKIEIGQGFYKNAK